MIALGARSVLLVVFVATAMASPARGIHRGYDAPFGSYRFMVSLRLAETPETNICTKGVRLRSTVNRGDSGGPLLVRDRRGALRQVGVTALGSDSTTKLYAGFTSIPVERTWLDAAIRALSTG